MILTKNSRVWDFEQLGPYEMGLLSEAMCSVWPSLQRPYSGCDVRPRELWLAIFDLLDHPRTVSNGDECGGSIRGIKHPQNGGFSRASGAVYFMPHTGFSIMGEPGSGYYGRNQFCFGQEEDGFFYARIDFGRRSVTAASYLLEEITNKNLFSKIREPDLDIEPDVKCQFMFGGLKVDHVIRDKIRQYFGENYLAEVEVLVAQ